MVRLPVDPSLREHLLGMEAIAVGPDGDEVLIGLNADETLIFLDYIQDKYAGPTPVYADLQKRHETARRMAIARQIFPEGVTALPDEN